MTSGDRKEPRRGLPALADRYRLDEPAVSRLAVLVERLSGDERAPTTIRSPGGVLERHVADSLVALEVEQLGSATSIADLGSGAGVPGLVLAAALPGARLALVESQARKCAFIASLAAAMELENATVVRARAEEWEEGIGAHDAVLARALAAQPVVLEYGAPLLRLGGVLVDWRGRRDQADEAAGARAAEALGLRLREVRRVEPFAAAQERHLHVFEKVAATPRGYPRRAGLARRKPLGGQP